jgi:DNA-binding protein H-NS
MPRKKKEITEEKIKAAQKLQELQKLEEDAAAEEEKLLEDTREAIETTAKNAGMFCGVILTPEDLGNVVALAAKSGENVRIPFRLYFKED